MVTSSKYLEEFDEDERLSPGISVSLGKLECSYGRVSYLTNDEIIGKARNRVRTKLSFFYSD
jgi:hypothetical protein